MFVGSISTTQLGGLISVRSFEDEINFHFWPFINLACQLEDPETWNDNLLDSPDETVPNLGLEAHLLFFVLRLPCWCIKAPGFEPGGFFEAPKALASSLLSLVVSALVFSAWGLGGWVDTGRRNCNNPALVAAERKLRAPCRVRRQVSSVMLERTNTYTSQHIADVLWCIDNLELWSLRCIQTLSTCTSLLCLWFNGFHCVDTLELWNKFHMFKTLKLLNAWENNQTLIYTAPPNGACDSMVFTFPTHTQHILAVWLYWHPVALEWISQVWAYLQIQPESSSKLKMHPDESWVLAPLYYACHSTNFIV